MLDHIAEIVAAGGLPVSADLENGFGDAPRHGGRNDPARGRGRRGGRLDRERDGPRRCADLCREAAIEHIAAAVDAARALPFPFTLTARCENLHGRHDLADTIARLVAYRDAGADVLYAPGITDANDIAAVTQAVGAPVNVVMGLQGRLAEPRRAGGARRESA